MYVSQNMHELTGIDTTVSALFHLSDRWFLFCIIRYIPSLYSSVHLNEKKRTTHSGMVPVSLADGCAWFQSVYFSNDQLVAVLSCQQHALAFNAADLGRLEVCHKNDVLANHLTRCIACGNTGNDLPCFSIAQIYLQYKQFLRIRMTLTLQHNTIAKFNLLEVSDCDFFLLFFLLLLGKEACTLFFLNRFNLCHDFFFIKTLEENFRSVGNTMFFCFQLAELIQCIEVTLLCLKLIQNLFSCFR